MILDKQTKEFIRNNPDKFTLSIHKNNQPSWEDYVEQYRYIVFLLAEQGKQLKYSINRISHPFLYLIRHFFELHLKNEMIKQGISPIREHNFKAIFKQYEENNILVPNEIKEAIDILDFDEDGACYRYYKGLDDNIYFRGHKVIEIHRLFESYSRISQPNLFYKQLTLIDQFDKRLIWEFTCHMHEITTQGQIRTEYDFVISYIIKLIANGTVDISKIYLPLMFLIRHSIELALKDNAIGILILETDTITKEKIEKKIKLEHSLSRLYNIFNKYLMQAPLDNTDDEFKRRTSEFYETTERLKNIIHDLDSNSRQFRYIPENDKIKIETHTLLSALDLYIFTDPFLTFCIDVFKESSIIPYSDEELYEMFGYG